MNVGRFFDAPLEANLVEEIPTQPHLYQKQHNGSVNLNMYYTTKQ